MRNNNVIPIYILIILLWKQYYTVKFCYETTVRAEDEIEAEDIAREYFLEWDWYYVHDYINTEFVRKATKEEVKDYI